MRGWRIAIGIRGNERSGLGSVLGPHTSASADSRCAFFFPPDLATVVSIRIASRSDRLVVNGSTRGRAACPFHSGWLVKVEQKATKETKKAFGWQRTAGPSVPSNAESHADAPSAAASVRRLASMLRYLRFCSRFVRASDWRQRHFPTRRSPSEAAGRSVRHREIASAAARHFRRAGLGRYKLPDFDANASYRGAPSFPCARVGTNFVPLRGVLAFNPRGHSGPLPDDSRGDGDSPGSID